MSKRKFINNPDTIADEFLEGFALALPDFVDVKGHCVMYKGMMTDENPKIITMYLGGAGHEPGSLSFIGRGWENLRVVGDIFAAPSAKTVLEGIHLANEANGGKGIFFYCGNHEGDVMAAKMAVKKAKKEGINIELFIMKDDCSVFDRTEMDQRRHLFCGSVLSKLFGAASEAGYTMEQMRALGNRFLDNVASLAAANRGATHPVTDQMITEIPEGKMVIGMGHHGEGAKDYLDMMTSANVVETMASRIAADINLKEGDEVIATINGAGSTTYMELMILYKDLVHYLENRGVTVVNRLVGTFLTTQEQAGFIMSIARVDKEMQTLFNAPCRTPFVTKL